jgi:hypothetical protein
VKKTVLPVKKKPPVKRLHLRKESIRTLSTTDLQLVAGGSGCGGTGSDASRGGGPVLGNPTTCAL